MYMENDVITKVVEKTIHIPHLNEDLFYIEPEFGNVEMTDFKYTPSDNDRDPIINIDVDEDTNQKELIEQDLDNQPDDTQLDEFISTLEYPEILPSCKPLRDWMYSQVEYKEYEAKVMILEEEVNDILTSKYNSEVLIPYRKELREWWFNRKNKLDDSSSNNV